MTERKCRTCKNTGCQYENDKSRSCLVCAEASRLRRSIKQQARWKEDGNCRPDNDCNPLASYWLRRAWRINA